MSTAPSNQQNDKDQKLLHRLLLMPVTQPTRKQRLNTFFSHPAWQSVGAIFGLLSLIVTIVLTIYIFNLTRQQETATVTYRFKADIAVQGGKVIVNPLGFSSTSDITDSIRITRGYEVSNKGPATAKGVLVVISHDSYPIKCNEDHGRFLVKQRSDSSCEFFFDYIYPNVAEEIFISVGSGKITTISLGRNGDSLPVSTVLTPKDVLKDIKIVVAGENVISEMN